LDALTIVVDEEARAMVKYDDYGFDVGRRWPQRAGFAVALALVIALPIYLLGSDDDSSSARVSATVVSAEVADTAIVVDPTIEVGRTVEQDPPIPPTTADRSTSTSGATSSSEQESDFASTTTVTATVTATVVTSPRVEAGTPYPMLPDGSPQPVVAIFDVDTITLTGMVPTEEAAARLASLAVANSKTPAAVVNNLIINPDVPINVGVRVIELNSVRFPSASARVLPAHAAELDRVATVMNLLPNVSVLVVGHADQRGTDAANLTISAARAQAVVNYLIYVGISPSRLSSRGVGATDLLEDQGDEVALALNRRTEFIFYGLLVE
jgi:outer membrane protein OmpA-like peptidoglycan-associated protein